MPNSHNQSNGRPHDPEHDSIHPLPGSLPDLLFESVEDQKLKEVLGRWQPPAASEALNNRVLNSYREAAVDQAFANVFSEQEHRSGVVEMKHCPTCQQDFAEKFSFCPEDGTPLVAAAAIGNSTAASAISSDDPSSSSNASIASNAAAINEATNGHDSSVAGTASVPVTAAAPSLLPGAQPGTHHRPVGVYSAAITPPTSSGDTTTATATTADAATVASATASSALVPMRGEFHLTMLQDEGLVQRLSREIAEVGRASQLTWPEFRRDPVGFTKRGATAYGLLLWRFFSNPNVAFATLTALLVISAFVGLILALDRRKTAEEVAGIREEVQLINPNLVEIPEEPPKPKEVGAAGTAKGKGGGEKPKFEKPAGGGGGGREDPKPASQGKLPPASLTIPQVVAPDPKPPVIKNPSLPTPATIVADPTLFPPDNRQIAFGDPKSKAKEPSSGSGTGNGIGDGKGGGVGVGEGSGVGPGRGGNTGGSDMRAGGGGPGGGGEGVDYTKTFALKEVTRKAIVTQKFDPDFTEEARKNNTTGIVRLRVALNANGTVTNISAIKGLPDGLTEKAIAAAKKIKFTPAQKDGRPVSQWATIEYNFNIY